MNKIVDLKEYLKCLRAIFYAHLDEGEVEFEDVKKQLYETFFTFANDPILFDDMETITEINRLHMDLEAGSYINIHSSRFNYNYKLVKSSVRPLAYKNLFSNISNT